MENGENGVNLGPIRNLGTDFIAKANQLIESGNLVKVGN